jgi:hypothetical protein
MTAKATRKPKATTWDCPNPRGKYTLWELITLIKTDKDFAQFFRELLKSANNNEKGAIECVDSYFEPTADELEELGVPLSQINSLRRCTESGLLVAAIIKDNV